MKTKIWITASVALSIACNPAEDLPPPPVSGTGIQGDSSGGTSAYDGTADTGALDDTAGTGGGSTCDPDSAEFVCRGFAVGVYINPEGIETISPAGADVVHLCIDPVVTGVTDPNHMYQDIRMCAPFHGIDLLDCENPNDAGEVLLCDDLAEHCRARCEDEVVFSAEVGDFSLDHVECIVTISDTLGYGPTNYNPECAHSEQLRVDHRFPRQEAMLNEDYKPCSLESCPMAACRGYDPIGGVGFANGLDESRAVMHRGLVDDLRVDPLSLWECDTGRYAEVIIEPGDPRSGIPPTTEWRFESLEPGGLLYELGLRTGDANARVWAHDPATGAPTTRVYELDSVGGLADAYAVLFGESHLTIEVDRPRTATSHTILVSVEDCGIHGDGDGTTDIVRCPNP
jgi:hypothetical protein